MEPIFALLALCKGSPVVPSLKANNAEFLTKINSKWRLKNVGHFVQASVGGNAGCFVPTPPMTIITTHCRCRRHHHQQHYCFVPTPPMTIITTHCRCRRHHQQQHYYHLNWWVIYIYMYISCLSSEWIYGEMYPLYMYIKPALSRVVSIRISSDVIVTLQWRHNERDGVPNHQPHDCLFKRLFRGRSKKTPKLCVTDFVRGIHRWPVNSPEKEPVARKMFPFDDVIMKR